MAFSKIAAQFSCRTHRCFSAANIFAAKINKEIQFRAGQMNCFSDSGGLRNFTMAREFLPLTAFQPAHFQFEPVQPPLHLSVEFHRLELQFLISLQLP